MKTYIQTLIVFFLFISCSKDVEPEVIPKYNLKVSITPTEGGTVTPSEGSYPNETTVSLLATPSPEYIFKEWTGGITGTSNPVSVTMSSNKNISVIFEKRKYPLSIIIEGEGTVTEELLSSKSTSDYPSGSVVKLTAVPIDGWKFVEWIGDYEGTDNPINITVDKAKTLTVKFKVKNYYQIENFDYNRSSYETRISYLHKDYFDVIANVEASHGPLEAVILDYDKDGFLDFVHTNSDYVASGANNIEKARNKILFFKGDSNGNLHMDETLSNKFDGLIHGRKGIVGDFNNDGFPDIFFAGHGTDSAPYSLEYPILLMNDNGNNFIETRFTELIGFFHSITSGDYDKDGDLDIVLVNPFGISYILNNIGDGNFNVKTGLIPSEKTSGGFTSELFDIDQDGYLDLIISGHDFIENPNWDYPSVILYGNGHDYNGRFETLPSLFGYGICIDLDFYDINSDGKFEIIMNRTGDPLNGNGNYSGWAIQILEILNGKYEDATDKYITNNSSDIGDWMYWLHITDKDNDGVVELFNDDLDSHPEHPYREWKLINGKFNRAQ